MDSYSDVTTPLWDLSQATSFSQIPDNDFIALLQKQFPSSNGIPPTNPLNQASINPQNISRYSLSSLTPPSEDSSPSPPQTNAEQMSQSSPTQEEGGDHALKRKASIDDDLEEGPSQKTQHTLNSSRKSSTSIGGRRKSTGVGGTTKDESRLLKRKEQNRAAQRAFRERKEKHVKDLEDKVAALEAKNQQAVTENENLRDLLSRLQSENVLLKQSSFTFSMPKAAGPLPEKLNSLPRSTAETGPFASGSHSLPAVSSPALGRGPPPKAVNPLDWSSLTSFDPAMLKLLDDQPQPTATDSAMQMNFGFHNNYTTIANNPMFMSYASTFDPNPVSSDPNSFTFDLNSLPSWPFPSTMSQDQSSLDEIFAPYLGQASYQYPGSTAISPITHHTIPTSTPSTASNLQSPGVSSSSSPASSGSDGVATSSKDTPTSSTDSEMKHMDCPKTKADVAQLIESNGLSPFAPTKSTLKKTSDGVLGPVITCQGSSFPKTMASDQNVEVLQAWRTITSNPKFKECDINELCSEFTRKARCDGTKVVLEPQGVHHILESLSSASSRQ